MHVHLPPDNALRLTPSAALLYLQHGVTTIREAGDLDGTAVAAARRLERDGAHPVPRLFSCGPFVGAGKAGFKNTILLEDASARAADAAAVRVKATGATFLKFYEGLTEPMIRALEQACARHGLKMMGHVPAGMRYEDARIAEVQHFFGVPLPQTLERDTLVNRSCDWHAVDERRMDEIVEVDAEARYRQYADHRHQPADALLPGFRCRAAAPAMRNVPPFYLDVIWHPERGRSSNRMARDYLDRQVVPAVAKKQRLTRKLFDAGARLFLGTDVAQPFVVPGASLQQEMALFAEAGIGIEQVWKLATRDAGDTARHRGIGAYRGRCAGRHPVVSPRPDPKPRQPCEPGGGYRRRQALSVGRSCASAAFEHGLFQLAPDQAAGAPRRRTSVGAGVRTLPENDAHRRYFRVKASLASMPSTPGKPGRAKRGGGRIDRRRSATAVSLDPAGDRLAQHAAEIDRPVSVRHHFGGDSLQAIALSEHRFGIVRRHGPRGGGIGRIGEGHEHRNQRCLYRHDAGQRAHLVERHPLAAAAAV